MPSSQNVFALLADRADDGELRRQMEPEMVHIVRRVIKHGAGRSSMDRRILAEAGRIGLDAEAARGEDGERLIRKVAHSVSVLFVQGLRAGPLDRCRVEETVCA